MDGPLLRIGEDVGDAELVAVDRDRFRVRGQGVRGGRATGEERERGHNGTESPAGGSGHGRSPGAVNGEDRPTAGRDSAMVMHWRGGCQKLMPIVGVGCSHLQPGSWRARYNKASPRKGWAFIGNGSCC